MSALTDYFTSLANSIRAKTGKSDTLTPSDMVDEVDVVYDTGVTAGQSSAKVGTATAGDVLSGKTFTNSSTVGESGSMTNNGAVSATLNTTTTSYTVPAGYHDGSGSVSITTQTKTSTPTSRSATAATVTPDSGKVLSSVTVNTTSVPNSNSGTYTYPAGSTGATYNMGATNTIQYVNAENVYSKGKEDSQFIRNIIVGATLGDGVTAQYKPYTATLEEYRYLKVTLNNGGASVGSLSYYSSDSGYGRVSKLRFIVSNAQGYDWITINYVITKTTYIRIYDSNNVQLGYKSLSTNSGFAAIKISSYNLTDTISIEVNMGVNETSFVLYAIQMIKQLTDNISFTTY